jgi:hypothetical protein
MTKGKKGKSWKEGRKDIYERKEGSNTMKGRKEVTS